MIKTNTIYLFQFSNGSSYETPKQETLEAFYKRKDITTMDEALAILNSYNGLLYFIGTQDEYDVLNDVHYIYFKANGLALFVTWQGTYELADGKVKIPVLADLTTEKDAIQITKTEYDVLHTKNNADNTFNTKLSNLKNNSSPKLAAYIAKCEDYIAEHVDDLKAPQLKTFILANGKIDEVALEKAIKANQDKSDSIALLCEAYLSWIVLIEKGTQAGLDELPETDPTKLNAIIDALWKAEHDKERKALIAKLNSSEAEFAIVDKYLVVTQGDEPEIK